MPGSKRSASATLVAPERRISSLVTTATAAAAPPRLSLFLETDVTSISKSSSRLSFFSAAADGSTPCAFAKTLPTRKYGSVLLMPRFLFFRQHFLAANNADYANEFECAVRVIGGIRGSIFGCGIAALLYKKPCGSP